MNQENPYAAPQTTTFTELQNFGNGTLKSPKSLDPIQRFAKQCNRLLLLLMVLVLMSPGFLSFLFIPLGILILGGFYLILVFYVLGLSVYPLLRPRRMFAAAAGMMVLVPTAGFIGHSFLNLLKWRDLLLCFNSGLLLTLCLILWAFVHVARHQKERWFAILNWLGIVVLIAAAMYLGYLYWIGHLQWGMWKPIYGIYTLLLPSLVLVIDLVFGSNLKGSAPE